VRATGVSYDTGFVRGGVSSREPFDPEVVRRELRIIRDDLHCNAVRVMGGDPERLELAAAYAAELGLEVWFSPYPLELTTDDLLGLFADCAERAERLRRRGAEVVFVTGAELSLMNKGFLPGDTFADRVELLLGRPQRLPELVPVVAARVNEFLAEAVALVRERFEAGGAEMPPAVFVIAVDLRPGPLHGTVVRGRVLPGNPPRWPVSEPVQVIASGFEQWRAHLLAAA
jgi:hypothetical protein